MSVARFRVVALLEDASRPAQGTVLVEREAGLFSVRQLRRHRLYTLPLADVASMVVRRIVAAEAREKLAAKRNARKGVRR